MIKKEIFLKETPLYKSMSNLTRILSTTTLTLVIAAGAGAGTPPTTPNDAHASAERTRVEQTQTGIEQLIKRFERPIHTIAASLAAGAGEPASKYDIAAEIPYTPTATTPATLRVRQDTRLARIAVDFGHDATVIGPLEVPDKHTYLFLSYGTPGELQPSDTLLFSLPKDELVGIEGYPLSTMLRPYAQLESDLRAELSHTPILRVLTAYLTAAKRVEQELRE